MTTPLPIGPRSRAARIRHALAEHGVDAAVEPLEGRIAVAPAAPLEHDTLAELGRLAHPDLIAVAEPGAAAPPRRRAPRRRRP